MKKGLEKIIIFLIGFVCCLSIMVSYATNYNSSEISYDNSISGSIKTNVKDAVDELYSKIIIRAKRPLCIGAKTLHTTTCNSSSGFGCQGAGIASGATITFGSLGTTGILASGDAFDCDVNGDGTYDAETERFYYVTDLASNTNKAVLIYYSNTNAGVADPTKSIAYNSDNVNNLGPVTAISDLPSTSQWVTQVYSNPRQIINENGGTITSAGNIVSYNYDGLAARLITVHEMNSACNKTLGSYPTGKIGELDTCAYLMENTHYVDTSLSNGYWLETPSASHVVGVWSVYGNYRFVYSSWAEHIGNFGVRPVIEVPKSEISY